jgi:hypothetical protein
MRRMRRARRATSATLVLRDAALTRPPQDQGRPENTAGVVGTTIKIFDAVQRAVQFLYEPFELNDIQVVDRAYAELGKTRQSIRKNEVALEIIEALIVKR